MWGQSKEKAVCDPGRQPSPDATHAGALLWDFQPPELMEPLKQPEFFKTVVAASSEPEHLLLL